MLALEYFRILFGIWFCFCLLDHLVGSTLNTHEITSHPSLLHADSLLHGYNAFGVLWQHRHMEGSFYNGAKHSYHEKKLHTSRRINAEPLPHICQVGVANWINWYQFLILSDGGHYTICIYNKLQFYRVTVQIVGLCQVAPAHFLHFCMLWFL